MKVYGVTGWKDMGKTTLVTRLVTCFCNRGLTVSTVKHAHHGFDVDQEGRDSYRHREAGASEVFLASNKRWVLMHELREEAEWELPELLSTMSPVDLVLVEGYKQGDHPKIEVFRADPARDPIALENKTVRAIAGNPGQHQIDLPVFDIDNIEGIADFIAGELGIT